MLSDSITSLPEEEIGQSILGKMDGDVKKDGE